MSRWWPWGEADEVDPNKLPAEVPQERNCENCGMSGQMIDLGPEYPLWCLPCVEAAARPVEHLAAAPPESSIDRDFRPATPPPGPA